MKELSIKEKAKAYDEAIDKVAHFIKKHIGFGCMIHPNSSEAKELFNIFPELAESEDERIRKELITHCRNTRCVTEEGAESIAKWIAWLEKQGEKHLENYDEAEKEKVNFVGDGFIECHANFLDFKEGSTYWLEYIGNDMYNVRSDNLLGKTYHITPCQLYTVFKKLTWLEKQGANSVSVTEGNASVTNAEVVSHPTVTDSDDGKCTTASITIEPKFKVGDWITNGDYIWKIVDVKPLDYILQSPDGNIVDDTISYVDKQFNSFTIQDANAVVYNIQPATKEQREQLEKAMADTGLEFDFEKKELKKIEQKSVWSEEDEYLLDETIKHLEELIRIDTAKHCGCDVQYYQRDIDWLKSIKERIGE